MSVDGDLAVVGVVAAVAGIGVTVGVALRTWRLPEPLPWRRSLRIPTESPAGRVLAQLGRARDTARRVLAALGRRPREKDYSGDGLVAFAAVAFVVFVALAVASITFARIEKDALRVVAVASVVASCALVGVLLRWGSRIRMRRALPWLVLVFLGDAGIALAPATFAKPWFAQGRFDHRAQWLPQQGGLLDRAKAALKIWDLELVFHVLAQSLGLTMLLVAVISSAGYVVRLSRRTRPRTGVRSLVGATSLVVVGAVLASGALATVPARLLGTSVWEASASESSVSAESTPPVALQADARGRVALLFARCGRDRILDLTIDGKPVGQAFLGVPATSPVTRIALPAGTGTMTVRFRTTRSFSRTVVFPSRPKPKGFLPAKRGVTVQQFSKAGYAC
ncbi:hypothetical protein [Motilibacter peucedani]|uniref:hypothetical protein n=1 Tax=Motilibacter peucedani TaxID=598650 RepID=UPI0011C418BC|nr:hypothetical protein [Motilibacter peucedani]